MSKEALSEFPWCIFPLNSFPLKGNIITLKLSDFIFGIIFFSNPKWFCYIYYSYQMKKNGTFILILNIKKQTKWKSAYRARNTWDGIIISVSWIKLIRLMILNNALPKILCSKSTEQPACNFVSLKIVALFHMHSLIVPYKESRVLKHFSVFFTYS